MGVAVTVLAAGWSLRWYRAQRGQQDLAAPEADLRAVERRALTRELHHVVTHHLSTAALQVMSYLDTTDADELRAILAKVNLSVQAALAELRQVARLQRDDPAWRQGAGPAGELLPQVPPTAVGGRWARRLTEAGFAVTLAVPPAADQLRMSVQATVSDALEVACDNVLRHAPAPSACTISVDVGLDEVVLRVANPLTSCTPAGRGSGHSLRRLRERVDLSGGSFDAGPSAPQPPRPATWLVVVAVPL